MTWKSSKVSGRNYRIIDGKTSILFQIELPGYEKDKIRIYKDINWYELTIEASREDAFFGSLSESHSFELAPTICIHKDPDITYDLGILSLKFKKLEENQEKIKLKIS